MAPPRKNHTEKDLRLQTKEKGKQKTDTSTGLEGPKLLENRSSFTAEALAVFGIIITLLNFISHLIYRQWHMKFQHGILN